MGLADGQILPALSYGFPTHRRVRGGRCCLTYALRQLGASARALLAPTSLKVQVMPHTVFVGIPSGSRERQFVLTCCFALQVHALPIRIFD